MLRNLRFLWSWLRLSQYLTKSLMWVGVIRRLSLVGLKGSVMWVCPCISGQGESSVEVSSGVCGVCSVFCAEVVGESSGEEGSTIVFASAGEL